MPALQLALLGPLQITLGGHPAPRFATVKVQALLAYLAVEAQRAHARETLLGLFWPDYPQRSAQLSLRQTLFHLRQVLPPAYLLNAHHTIQFDPAGDYSLDVSAFTGLLTTCRQHTHPDLSACSTCLEHLAQAVALYRGDLLTGFFLDDSPAFEAWLLLRREWLRREALGALHQLATAYEQRGDYAQAQQYAWRQVELDPAREEAHQQLMRVLALQGRRSEALAHFATCRRILAEELGVAPSAATVALYEQLRADTLPDKAHTAEKTRRQEEKETRRAGEKTVAPGEVTLSPPHPLTPAPLPAWPADGADQSRFVAREREVAHLLSALQQADQGQGQVRLVAGEAGSGKSALLGELARRAATQVADLLVVSGHGNAQSGAGDPYLPFRHLLRLLTGDWETPGAPALLNRTHAQRLWTAAAVTMQTVVERGSDLINTFLPGSALVSRATNLVAPGASWLAQLEKAATRPTLPDLGQYDLVEQYTAVVQSLARRQPLLLLVDDLHWADAASLNLFFHLGRHLHNSRILLVGAYRPAEVALGRVVGAQSGRHPLEAVTHELQRTHGAITIDLDAAPGREFIDAWLDAQPNRLGADFRAALYQRTEGQPLFTVELWRAMQARGELRQDATGCWVAAATLDWQSLPVRVEAVIEERIGRLADVERELLAVASVEGELFTAQVLACVQKLGERLLLQRLAHECERRHHLVRPQAEVQVGPHWLSRYRFTHVLFQQQLYQTLTPGERRLLHGEIAAALVDLYGGEAEEITVQLAHHYAEAGDWARAVEYLLQAGDRARTLYAHQEAIAAYQRALVLLKQAGDYDRAARTLMKLGLTYHLAFDFRQAQHAFDEGFALWQRVGEAPRTALPPASHALRLNWFEPPTLDPAGADMTHSAELLRQLFSGLVGLSPELDVVPALARTWAVSNGGRTYHFHLRDKLYWSDGVPLTAADFVYAWQRALQPTNPSVVASSLFVIKGARAFHQGAMTDPRQIGVYASDAHTLVVELEEPSSYLPHLLTYPGAYPVPRHVVAAHGAAWTTPGNLVTNGPFQLERWQREQRMVLVRNPAYHGRFTGNVQRVELTLLPEGVAAAALACYEADALDIAEFIYASPAEIDCARQQHAGEYAAGPLLYTDLIAFHVSRPPFADVRVRQAFALAVNRETLADNIGQGYLSPGTGGLVPPGMPGHSPGVGLPYNPDQARQLLAAAGYPAGRGFPTIDGLIPTGLAAVGAFLQTQWRDNLGVTVAWQSMAWTAIYERLDQEPPLLFLSAWLADYPDPDNFLRMWPHRHRHMTGWQDEHYTGLVERAGRTLDQGERMALYQQADRRLIEEAVILPLTYWRRHLLLKPWVKRFPTSPLSFWYWQDVIIEPH